jgi:hypothetical protein
MNESGKKEKHSTAKAVPSVSKGPPGHIEGNAKKL